MSYPDNNPKTAFGLKKVPLHLVPPALEQGAAEAFQNGADKYGPFNWRDHTISATVYYAACKRHLDAWFDRTDAGDAAPDSGVHHIKHAAACLAMILDVMGTERFNDNRPTRRPTCPADTTQPTSSETKNARSRSKSARSATKPVTISSEPAKSIKATESTSTTATLLLQGAQIIPPTGGYAAGTLTGPRET
jgi:hypothetical protein